MENLNPAHTKILKFSQDAIDLDAALKVDRIVEQLKEQVNHTLHRQGVVLGISGGIDSSVVLALCVRAFGAQRVVGLILPEKESSPESRLLAQDLASQLDVQTIVEDITLALEGAGCYRRRDEAIRRVFPVYEPGWQAQIVLPSNLLEKGSLNIFQLVVTDPQGNEYKQRLPLHEYLQIVAASNFKQRARMSMLYYHAELRNYAVIGTPNKDEHDLGFFVKFGDGGYDFAPIRHLFKTQVYQLAEYLQIPENITSRTPSTDTYPGGGSQEEFFFRIPFKLLDAAWMGFEQGVSTEEIANALSLTQEQVGWVVEDIQRKRRTTEYQRYIQPNPQDLKP